MNCKAFHDHAARGDYQIRMLVSHCIGTKLETPGINPILPCCVSCPFTPLNFHIITGVIGKSSILLRIFIIAKEIPLSRYIPFN